MKYFLITVSLILSACCEELKCGIKNTDSELEGKIMGGQETDPNEYPWQISLQYRYTRSLSQTKLKHIPIVKQSKWFPTKHYCGASLIDSSWAITAAHCVDGLTEKNILVKAGKHNLHRLESTERWSDVERIIPHENWKIHGGNDDITLLKLKKPFQMSKSIATICLPFQSQNTTGIVTVSGWGATRSGSSSSSTLMKVDVPVISDEACILDYSQREIRSSMICAGYQGGGHDSCQGDSGGPMISSQVINGSSSYYLAGIVSWGEGCGLPAKPGVYTEVSYYIDWIHNHIKS